MQYRDIGKTGKQAGVIGLGGEHLDHKPYEQVEGAIHAALECGVNLVDVFMPGREVRENIARALGGRRKDVQIQGHIGAAEVNGQYDISRDMPTVKRYFEDCLRVFGGYIDFGMLFFIDSQEDFDKTFHGGLADYALALKQKGHIGHIGFSSHNPVFAAKAVETGLPEIMLFSINLAFDMTPRETDVLSTLDHMQDAALFEMDSRRADLYALCERSGVGISVMKTLGAGKLVTPGQTPFSMPMSVNQCIRYALSRPGVCSVLLGCQTAEEVRGAMAYFAAAEEECDYTPFLGESMRDFAGHCVYCNHCQPCPVGIDIAAVHKYLDIARLDEGNIPPSIRSHYAGLQAGGDACIACGSCEGRCPFAVPVIENMAAAARLLARA